jgi:hypothetical protein
LIKINDTERKARFVEHGGEGLVKQEPDLCHASVMMER